MKNLEAIRTAGQENLSRLVELGKQQPSEVQTWGVTAAAAVAGGLVMAAGAQGLVAILATLASLPVSLTVGAIGGGALGWAYMERHKTASQAVATDALPNETRTQIPVPSVITPEYAANDQSTEEQGVILVATKDEPLTVSDEPVGEAYIVTPEGTSESEPVEATAASHIEVAAPPTQQDQLEAIVGVGPVFATRLQAAGIYTFAQLAALTPEQVEEIMAPSRGGHMIDAAAWIEQARQLAASAQA